MAARAEGMSKEPKLRALHRYAWRVRAWGYKNTILPPSNNKVRPVALPQ